MASQQQITTNVARRTYLISRQGFVLRVTEDSVDGSEHGTSDPLTILEMLSVGPGEIVLRGESANRYIGMNSDGNLLTYVDGSRLSVKQTFVWEERLRDEPKERLHRRLQQHGQNSLAEDCVFKEHHNLDGYSSFESRTHTGWYLALTNDGRAKPGPKTAQSQRAVEFLPGTI